MGTTIQQPDATTQPPKKRNFVLRFLHYLYELVWDKIGLGKFATIFVLVCPFVFGVWNPTGYSFVGIVWGDSPAPVFNWFALHAWEVLFAVIFAAVWVFLIRTTHKSLGRIGVFFAVAVFVILVGIFALNTHISWGAQLIATVVFLGIAVLFTIGLAGANITRSLTGIVTASATATVDNVPTDHHG